MSAAVIADGLTYRRGAAVLVDQVSLAVRPGEVLGIVGPNGAGKTTLLSLLAGDLVASAGRAQVLGLDPSQSAPVELARIRAYLSVRGVSENPFTVRDTVAMGRHPHRRITHDAVKDAAIVDTAMERTDVAHLADRTVNTLSTGELQRVGLARVIAQEAPVLLLDEPTSALDIGHQELVMRLLRALAERGTAVISVLHDINLAAAHTDRMLLMNTGRAIAIGSPSEVVTSETLSATFHQVMEVIPHPYRDCPLVLTVDHPRRGT